MKKTFTYINSDTRWLLLLDGQNVQVFCNGESRTYTIPEPVISFNVGVEYFFINVEGKKFYQFKFEVDKFLVADIFTNDGKHLGEFASHVFGEE